MPIAKFDNTIFNGQPELSFLHLNNSFEIDFSKNNIIFAFNGTCKTTISNYLANHYSDQFFLINYEDNKDAIKAVKTGKTIEVLPDVVALEIAQSELDAVKNQINVFNKIENGFGISKSKIPSSKIGFLKNIKNSDILSTISLTEDEFNEINNVLSPVKKEFGKHFRELVDETHKVSDEVENMQNSLIKEFCNNYLSHLQVNEDSSACPICGGNIENGLKALLTDKIARFSSVVDPYFSNFLVQNTKEQNDTFLLNLSNLITKYKSNEEKLCEYLFVDDYSEVSNINSLVAIQTTKISNLNTAESSVAAIATGIRNSESFIKDLFVNKLKFKDAKYDSKKKGLILTIPDDRPASSYSQGELNLITLMTRLTIAKSTDKTNIILDDPLSSYDIPNQYRIVYEIVKYIRENTNKKVLIFTHNSDALNIAKQYNYGCDFEFFYVEKYQGELSIERLSINKNIINIDDIVNCHDDDGLLRANRDRENPLFIDSPMVTRDNLHELFHYNGAFSSCTYNSKVLSSEQLFNKIDGYTNGAISDEGFIKNTVNKVLYLMGIRVYIEKKLFDISSSVYSSLSSIDQFGEKLKEIQVHYLSDAVNRYQHFDIEILKRMKVMLNQNDHYKSQVQPYYYAMNISLDELIDEIEQIKNMFS